MPTIAIPQTVAELQELLKDEKRAGEIIANGQLPEVITAYNKAQNSAERDAFREQLTSEIQSGMVTALKEMGVNRLNLGSGAHQNAAYNGFAPGVRMEAMEFKHLGELAYVLMHGGDTDELAQRFQTARRITNEAFSSIEPSAGGFLIPETQRSEIMRLALERSIVRPRATVITMDSLTLPIPFVDETTHVGSVFGGLTFTWTPEGGTIGTTATKFGRVKLEANKLTGGTEVPNELAADARGLTTFLNAAIPSGLAFFEDLAFFSEDGVDKPEGFRNSPARVGVARAGAGSIVTADVLDMFSRMLPTSHANAAWMVNQTAFPDLATLSIDVGTGGSAVGLVQQNIGGAPGLSILGRPLIITEKVPALGSADDLMYVDLSYYLIGDRQMVSIDTSPHVKFMQDATTLRVIERVDGRSWIRSALTPVNGDDVSPFVGLDA